MGRLEAPHDFLGQRTIFRLVDPAGLRDGRKVCREVVKNRRAMPVEDTRHYAPRTSNASPGSVSREDLPHHDAEAVHIAGVSRHIGVQHLSKRNTEGGSVQERRGVGGYHDHFMNNSVRITINAPNGKNGELLKGHLRGRQRCSYFD